MKTVRLSISIVLIILVVIGWGSSIGSLAKSAASRQESEKAGLSYFEEGLYQKSIQAFEYAQAEQYKVKTEEALVKAYKAAYYDGTGTADDYTSEYLSLCQYKPSATEYWRELLEFCYQEEDYRTGFDVCKAMKKLGINDEALYELTDKFNYYVSEKKKVYNILSGGANYYYSAFDGKRWRVVSSDNEYFYEDVGPYIGGVSSACDYVIVYETDARLIDKNDVVQAILAEHTDNMRAYGCDMIPMQQKDGTWNYYNTQEKKYILTGYDDASSFQDDVAVVKEGSVWTLIGADGSTCSDTEFSDVKLYDNGEFIKDGIFVAAVDGAYNLYDTNGKALTEINAADMDLYFGDNIAFCDNSKKWGYMDTDGEILIEPQFTEAHSFSYGIAGVSNGTKWAFLNNEGRVVSDYRFMYIGYKSKENYCVVGDMNNEYFMAFFNFM